MKLASNCWVLYLAGHLTLAASASSNGGGYESKSKVEVEEETESEPKKTGVCGGEPLGLSVLDFEVDADGIQIVTGDLGGNLPGEIRISAVRSEGSAVPTAGLDQVIVDPRNSTLKLPGLSASDGNVLIINESDDLTHPKANAAGGTISFRLSDPAHEITHIVLVGNGCSSKGSFVTGRGADGSFLQDVAIPVAEEPGPTVVKPGFLDIRILDIVVHKACAVAEIGISNCLSDSNDLTLPRSEPRTNETECAGNTISSEADGCTPCGENEKANDSNTECLPLPCAVGSAGPGGAECSLCAPGTFASDVGQLECLACDDNSVSGKGAESCEVCGSGTEANAPQTQCVPCKPGTFSRNHDVCRTCRKRFTSKRGATRCFRIRTRSSSPSVNSGH